MELIERAPYLDIIKYRVEYAKKGMGNCVLLTGEADISKTSLVRALSPRVNSRATVLTGTWDSLFTPRPLTPLFDIACQLSERLSSGKNFSDFLKELTWHEGTLILIFENIHWDGETIFDFIKFLTGRIHPISCLFLLICREEAPDKGGILRPMWRNDDRFIWRLSVKPLSRAAVEKCAYKIG